VFSLPVYSVLSGYSTHQAVTIYSSNPVYIMKTSSPKVNFKCSLSFGLPHNETGLGKLYFSSEYPKFACLIILIFIYCLYRSYSMIIRISCLLY
jgi:hypothetical protein